MTDTDYHEPIGRDTDMTPKVVYAFLTLHRNALNSGIPVLGSPTRGLSRLVLSPLDNPIYPQFQGKLT